MMEKQWTKEEIETLTPEFKHWKTLNGTLKNTLAKALLETRLNLEMAKSFDDSRLRKIADLGDEIRRFQDALEQISKEEQAHCYGTDNEVNDLMQTRFDLRKCGDIAREALKTKP